MSRILQTKSMISWEENCECLTLQASTQRGIRQQPSQQPIRHKPPTSNQVRRPFCFSVRVTICCLQFGQVHCMGNSPGINIGVAAYIDCWFFRSYSIDCALESNERKENISEENFFDNETYDIQTMKRAVDSNWTIEVRANSAQWRVEWKRICFSSNDHQNNILHSY